MPLLQDDDATGARLQPFLTRTQNVALAFALFEALLAASYLSVARAIAAITLLSFCGCMYWARQLDQRGEERAAALLFGYTALSLIFVCALVLPERYPALVIGCIVVVLSVVPYVEGSSLRRIFAVAVFTIFIVAINGQVQRPATPVSDWLEDIERVSGCTAAGYLSLVLVWQYSTRLRQAFDRERHARTQAARAEARALFLARASETLAQSLDYVTTLGKVAELAVPSLADWCTVAVVDDENTVRRVAVLHRDPAKRELVEAYQRKFPPQSHRAGEFETVLRTGRAMLMQIVDDDALVKAAQDDEHLRIMRGLGVSSCIIAPLLANSEPVGAISLMLSTPGKAYDKDDLEMAKDIAHRAGLAVSNARLYRQERHAVEVRDQFLSIAGHEMRTPLSALQLQVQGLQRLLSIDEAAAREVLPERLARVVANTERLARLVDELLDVSRLTAGVMKLEKTAVDLGELVRGVALRHVDHAARVGSSLTVQAASSVIVQCDALRVEQVVENLLGNALKYGAGQPVEVEVAQHDEQAVLRVSDRGIGVAPADQDRIFDRFGRAASPRHYSGLGLGLWIVKQIVDNSGGRISVTSELGQGATFTVALPLV